MLYILIPCILLLIVAVVLKKRENENSQKAADSDKKSIAKKTNKSTPPRANRTSSPQTKVIVPKIVTERPTARFDHEVRASVEHLISTENYLAAEAKINQLLNQNNAQHELYIYLMDIHVAQNDDFAIKKLITHLRSLGLHEIADQAEIKQKITAASQATLPADIIDQAFKAKATQKKAPLTNDSTSKSATAFDDLISNTANNTSKNNTSNNNATHNNPSPTVNHSFDHLQAAPAATQVETNDLPPIEYSFSTAEPITAKSDAKNQAIEIEYAQITTTSDPITTPAAAVQQNSFETRLKETVTLEILPLEFNFSTPTVTEEKIEIKENSIAIEDFVFKEHSITETKVEQPSLEFKLDVNSPTAQDLSDFHFSLDTPISADTNSLSFEMQKVDLLAPPTTPEIDADQLKYANDPLAQSFPELLKINEIQLNLDLASRYIELGAYDAAKKLLASDEAKFSPQQRDRSQNLLNQIAS